MATVGPGASGGRPPRPVAAEQWRPVVGREDEYLVSDHGRVWSVRRTARNGRQCGGRYLTWSREHESAPYPSVTIESRRRTVHDLVAQAFHGPRPEGLEVRHLDGHHRNPRADNLAYGTRGQNSQDTLRHGANHQATKLLCPRDHALLPPNLTGHEDGVRRCRACRRAQNYAEKARRAGRPAVDVQAYADKAYRLILAGVDVCRRGHVLAAPNVRPGTSTCRACQHGWHTARREQPDGALDPAVVSRHADESYRRILGGGLVETRPARTVCGRGHGLQGSNVARDGEGRRCRACRRAQSAATHARRRGWPAVDVQAYADEAYRRIMAGRPAAA